jgi:hypothetical protein
MERFQMQTYECCCRLRSSRAIASSRLLRPAYPNPDITSEPTVDGLVVPPSGSRAGKSLATPPGAMPLE